MRPVITSFTNATVKRLRSLHDKKGRRAEGLFLAEGLRIVTEAVESGAVPALLMAAEDAADHPLAFAAARATMTGGGEALVATRDILAKVTGKDNPGAVVAAFPLRPTPLDAIDRAAASMWVVCEGLKDPGNLGTILRTCDAVGAGGVILLDQSCDPFSVEAVRASMGAIFTKQVAQADGAAFLEWLRGGPGMLVGAVLGADTIDYRAVRYEVPTFLLMGNEQSGLPPAYAAACDVRVGIPMLGKADSLNVAVATAVLLYEVLGQLGAATPPRAAPA